MAKNTTPQPDLTIRHELATAAAAEISALSTFVHDRIAGDPEGLALRAMLRRVERLSCIVLSAIDDPEESPASIREKLDERAHHD